MLKILNKYYRVWQIFASNELQQTFINRFSNILFFLGKAIRFLLLLLFIFLIKQNTQKFLNYHPDQLIIFFLTFNLIDLISQVLWRGVYVFRNKLISGEFDFFLAQPLNPLFRSLFCKPDINDVLFLIPSTLITLYLMTTLQLHISFNSLILYLLLLINALLISLSFHILVLSFGMITLEIDNTIFLYRHILSLGRFPVKIYPIVIQTILFTLLPIGIMISLPAEALNNMTNITAIAYCFLVNGIFLFLSLNAWKWSLKKYSSASS